MKIIHCADIHLDSKMTSNLSKEKAKERKFEILDTFLNMVEYGAEQGVKAILIAGDLFDGNNISANARNSVENCIRKHSEIDFYYLKGNHGGGDVFLNGLKAMPVNLKLFGDRWTTYELYSGAKKITLSGLELGGEREEALLSSLLLDPRNFNVVTLHGQIGTYQNGKSQETIGLRELRGKNIDYLALGHVHEYQEGELPPRGKYCYPGCLEGRGFDECGEHGFVLIDIEEEALRATYQFVPFAKRKIHEVSVDASECMTTPEIQEKMEEEVRAHSCKPEDLVKVVLTGEVDVSCEKNLEYLEKQLRDGFYFAKIKDETRIRVNYADYEMEPTLKGEFVRMVKAEGALSEEEKAEIIRCGLQALNEEEIKL